MIDRATLARDPMSDVVTAPDLPKISVVVPVYNSAASLPVLLDRLSTVLSTMGREYQIICVDDCSRDESWSVLQTLKERYGDRLKIIRLLVNSGQHNAILCGFSLVTGDVVVTMDDDLQNPPEELPRLILAAEEGFDLVIGAYDSKKHTRVRNFSGAAIDWLLRRMFDLPATFQLTSFRAARRSVIDQVNDMGALYPYITAMLLANSSRRQNVQVEHHPRLIGRSHYTMSRSLSLASNLILNYSSYPMLFVAAICLVSMLVFLTAGIVYTYLVATQGTSVPGWASLFLAMSFFNSLTLLCLFVFAMYMSRFHRQLTRTRVGYRIGQIS
jgi:polyisoprenyl-phosphate glycosyltransferase